MSTLDELVTAEIDRFTNAIKALVADHINALFTSPQTVEEQYPSAGTDPGPVTIPEPVVPEPAPSTPAPEGVAVSPGGDAQTVPEEPAPTADPPAPEPTTLGGEVVS